MPNGPPETQPWAACPDTAAGAETGTDAPMSLPWVEDDFSLDMLPDDTPEPARAVLVPSPPSTLASMPPSPLQPPPQPVAYTAVLPMTRPAQRSKPVPKDIWLWVPAVLAIIGKECEVDSQLAMRAGMTMRTNATTGLLEFEFVGLHDHQGQYLCRYVRAVFQWLGKKLPLSGWNALARHLRDPKTWDNSANGGEDLHNVRLFWAGSARGGNPTSSGGRQHYVERRQAQDPCYYRPGKRLAPGDEGGLPGATMQLARLLQERLEHGCTVHGVDLDPNPSLFAEARRQVEFLTAADAQMVAKALYKPENVPKPGSDAGLTPEAKEEVKALKKRGDKLVQGARFTEAADAYAQAHELHPDNQVLPKLVQKQRDAVMDTDYVAAQLAARGGTEIRWQDFVECWQSRPSVSSTQLPGPPPGPPVGPPPGPPPVYSSRTVRPRQQQPGLRDGDFLLGDKMATAEDDITAVAAQEVRGAPPPTAPSTPPWADGGGAEAMVNRPGMGEFANTPDGIHRSPPTESQRSARVQQARAPSAAGAVRGVHSSQARSTSPPRRASRDDEEPGSRMERMRSDRTDRSSGCSMASSMGGSMSSVDDEWLIGDDDAAQLPPLRLSDTHAMRDVSGIHDAVAEETGMRSGPSTVTAVVVSIDQPEEDPLKYLNSFGSEGGGMEPPPPASALSAGSSASLMSVDEEEKLSNSMRTLSTKAVTEWTVQVEQTLSWQEHVLQIEEDSGKMRLYEKRDEEGHIGELVDEKCLYGSSVSYLKKPRNSSGKCSPEHSAFRLELAQGEGTYKMVAMPPRTVRGVHSSQARSTSPPRRASRDDEEPGSRMERMRSDRTDRSSGSSMASSMGGSMSSVYAGSGGGGSDCWHSGKNRELRQQLERMGNAVPPLIGAKKRGGRGSGSRGDYKRSSPAEAVPPPSLRASLEDLINGGFLYKAGGEGVFYTSWKKRFFQLEGKLLKYYDEEPAAGGTYKGEIDLDQVNLDEPIVTVPGAEQEFKLRTSGRDWHFRWDNDCTGRSADTWKQGFLSVVKRASQRLSEMSRTHSEC